MCGTSGDEGQLVNFTLKRSGVAFQNERGASERHRFFNDREKLLKEKDLTIFVAITEKSLTFFKFCVLISLYVPLKLFCSYFSLLIMIISYYLFQELIKEETINVDIIDIVVVACGPTKM